MKRALEFDEHGKAYMGEEDLKQLLETLKCPPPLNEKFKQAFKEYYERIEKNNL